MYFYRFLMKKEKLKKGDEKLGIIKGVFEWKEINIKDEGKEIDETDVIRRKIIIHAKNIHLVKD